MDVLQDNRFSLFCVFFPPDGCEQAGGKLVLNASVERSGSLQHPGTLVTEVLTRLILVMKGTLRGRQVAPGCVWAARGRHGVSGRRGNVRGVVGQQAVYKPLGGARGVQAARGRQGLLWTTRRCISR